jgi:hypothetical protein
MAAAMVSSVELASAHHQKIWHTHCKIGMTSEWDIQRKGSVSEHIPILPYTSKTDRCKR